MMLGILSVLIIVHECGHFSVARFFGFQTPVFGFGLPFGPHWVVGKKWGTEFRVHAALLGGYVAIPELGDESNAEAFGSSDMKPFRKFPIWQRALVAFAGVGFNILFAYLIVLVMFVTVGQQFRATVVAALPPENPIAAKAGVKAGDQIVAIDSQVINLPDDAVAYLGGRKKAPVQLHILRDNKPITLDMTTNDHGKVGMALGTKGPASYKKIDGNFFTVAWRAVVYLYTLTSSMLDSLGEMLSSIMRGGKAAVGHPQVGIQDLHGVVAVVVIGADILKQDWSQLFLFTVLISMDLAIINLVPWPALDGGHLAFMAFEAVRGRPMGERAQGEIVKWGFISLILLMAVIMVNDVTALVTGKLDFKKQSEQKDQNQPGAGSGPAKSTAPADTKSGPTETKSAPSDAKSGSPETKPTPPDANSASPETKTAPSDTSTKDTQPAAPAK
jgi:membrane-associated protease RseP (regulator of RpoE activity)